MLIPINNGLELEKYKWTQNHKDITIIIPITENISRKDITIKFNHNNLYVNILGCVIINGDLFGNVITDNCTWIMDGNDLIIELDKKKFDEWWKYAIEGEPEIDLSKIVTERGSHEYMDQDTRMTIEKMIQEQKINK